MHPWLPPPQLTSQAHCTGRPHWKLRSYGSLLVHLHSSSSLLTPRGAQPNHSEHLNVLPMSLPCSRALDDAPLSLELMLDIQNPNVHSGFMSHTHHGHANQTQGSISPSPSVSPQLYTFIHMVPPLYMPKSFSSLNVQLKLVSLCLHAEIQTTKVNPCSCGIYVCGICECGKGGGGQSHEAQ